MANDQTYHSPDLRVKTKSDSKHPEVHSERMAAQMQKDLKEAQYVGDLINQGVYQVQEASWIPAKQKIPMVSQEVSEAWGELQE